MAACATKAVCVAKPNAPALRANPRRPSPVVARFGMPRMDQTLCGGQGFSRPNGHRASRRVVMAGRVGTGTNVEPPLGDIVPPGGNGGQPGQGGGGGGGGGDGGGEGGSDDNMDPAVATALLAAGRTVESFPKDFATGLLSGKVTVELLERYLAMEKNFFLRFVWGFQGMRERLLADPSFPVKMGIECGIGIFTKATAEKAKREDSFWNEIDFVAANVLMAIAADFMLTWLPAPTLALAGAPKATGAFARMFARCPDNAFQKVRPGTSAYTLVQRAGAVVRNGAKLLVVGTGASVFGVGMTNGLAAVRTALDPTWQAPNGPQDLVGTSLAYGTYMAVSSNLRYQIVAGVIEERGIETIFKGQPGVCHALSFVVRTLNTFVGSLLWVDFVRLCGVQKASTKEEVPAKSK